MDISKNTGITADMAQTEILTFLTRLEQKVDLVIAKLEAQKISTATHRQAKSQR